VENHTKESIINACNWNHEEDNWDWEYKLQRRFYLNDLRYKLSNLKLGVPSFLVSLKNVNNEDILNGIVGIDQFKDSLRSKKIFTVEHINLDSCKISKIPSIIFKSTKLKTLSLDHNQIKKIPRSICNLQFLRGLYLEGNQIRKIPNCIQNMRHLKVLVLKNNRIPEISINTSPLSSLKCLVL
jgi:Leucine-rich repeat (LRR) protein